MTVIASAGQHAGVQARENDQVARSGKLVPAADDGIDGAGQRQGCHACGQVKQLVKAVLEILQGQCKDKQTGDAVAEGVCPGSEAGFSHETGPCACGRLGCAGCDQELYAWLRLPPCCWARRRALAALC